MPDKQGQAVSLPGLAREYGLPRGDYQDLARRGLVTPLAAPHRGQDTLISAADAELLKRAIKIAAAGVALVTVLRVLRLAGAEVIPGGVVIRTPGVTV